MNSSREAPAILTPAIPTPVTATGNESTRHTIKSCDELTVVSDGVVMS